MALRKATNRMAYAKAGIYGTAGSGKSRTSTEIAIGLHKAIKSTKPIAVFDTEPAFSFLLPIFNKAGVEMMVEDSSRALSDLMTFMDEAEKTCDIAIIDSITHVWRDAQESYLSRLNKSRKEQKKKPIFALEFHHWRPIKAAWAEFTDRFLSSKMHVIVCGRAGSIYEYQDKDDGSGKKELITTGTRMAVEKELGYEPSLLIEMIADREDGKIVNVALVQKDRADTLNGKELRMPTYESFAPHFNALNIGGEHFTSMDARNSEKLFEGAEEGTWDGEARNREIWSEEVEEILRKHFPSQTATDKQSRADLIERTFNTRSWTRVTTMRADVIKAGYETIKATLEPPAGKPISDEADTDALDKLSAKPAEPVKEEPKREVKAGFRTIILEGGAAVGESDIKDDELTLGLIMKVGDSDVRVVEFTDNQIVVTKVKK